ncbi:MAG: VWA domain-containing protein, partial [Ignavibacteriae bacterium]|nr:VWA domain-containing protein [Ignavibacteriota bacterium]
MKNLLQFLFTSIFITSVIFANGVGIVDATKGEYLQLVSSKINVNVENQVAIITSEQTLLNNSEDSVSFKYGYPMPESASAISLEYFINNQWWKAQIRAEEQDTTLPGTGGNEIDQSLKAYMGNLPLYFNIEEKLNSNESVIIRLTFVELLKYKFGDVTFSCPNDYTLIQNSPIKLQQFDFHLTSGRSIEVIELLSHTNSNIIKRGNFANINFSLANEIASTDYSVKYTLSSSELGLFSFSTFQPDSTILDSGGNGFFTFVAEPDPSDVTGVINKVFTLIIDRSGSMEWEDRLIQAKEAARYIINNLNEGDNFNIVDFAGLATSFRETHVEYNSNNRDAALEYINKLEPTWEAAISGTNISGAFEKAIPQFS